ncbi:LysR family transcriptional regulator [Pseudomonas sp. NPDC077649]|uniref:LysR family transcriptional regulator n=1 Tax=Pseudomonas sp. NPDC077649 TaxID=3364423 RepID=UPI0037C50CC2
MSPEPLETRHSDEIAALLAVAENGSFVAAGRALQRHPSIVSKRVAAMEMRLGVRLIERSTRQVRLTPAGAQLTQRLRGALDAITEAQQEASLGAAEARGQLRVALPSAMGRMWLAPLLPQFLQRHPHITVVIDYSDRYVDIIAEGFDAAVRIGELNDNRLIAKKLSEHRRILCASPDYLARYGEPAQPKDLVEHNCLRFSGFASFPEWCLSRNGRGERVLVNGNLTSNDGESLLAAALQGAGIVAGGEWLMAREIAAGRLVQVLPGWSLDEQGGIYLLRPSARFAAASTLAFKEWVEGEFAQGPPWKSASL